MSRVAVVGGGVIGTALAVEATDRGHEVVQLERELEPRGASVRNFGLVWICGRAGGRELELALEGRRRWKALAKRSPAIGFRPTGALVLAETQAELDLAHAACARDDAAERQFRVLTATEAQALEPALDQLLGALHSPLDAVVEPAAALAALRRLAGASGRYRFVAGRTVVEAEGNRVRDHTCEEISADVVAVCTGTDTELLPTGATGFAVRNLQMLGSAQLSPPLRTALAGGDSMRYYPAFDLPERAALSAAEPVVERFGAQLLVAPRLDGRLTIGDTHVDDRPGSFGSEEDADRYLLRRAGEVIGRELPRIERRWTGSYLRRTDGRETDFLELSPNGTLLVMGVGGMGMTAAPAVAAAAADLVGL